MSKTAMENFKAIIAIKGIEERVINIIRERDFTLDYYLKDTTPLYYFDNLGCWSDFSEGHDFWAGLHAEWEAIYKSGVVLDKPLPNLKSIW